jgi:hypothetical protein
MRDRRNFYRILKVQPDAPVEIIRASYRTLMRELKQHPDLGGSVEAAAILNEAYEVLSDPLRRAKYDRQLSIQFNRRPASPPPKVENPEPPSTCAFCRQKLGRKARPGEACPNCESPMLSEEMAELQNDGRRSVVRMRRAERLMYYITWPEKGRQGRLIDLSPKGTRFVSSEMIPLGSVVKISAGPFEAVATITNIQQESGSERPPFSIGAAFITVKFEARKGTFISTSI